MTFMTIQRGNCGHIKSHWDNHKKCINCSHFPGNLLVPHVAAGPILIEGLT